jgi:serine phosphatase RsbU (regulator of sigma subunit)
VKKQFIEKEILVRVPVTKPAPAIPEKTTREETQPEVAAQAEGAETGEANLSQRDQRKLKRQQKKETRQADTTGGQASKKDITSFFSSIVKSLETKPSATQTPLDKKAEIKQDSYKKQKIYSLQSISHEFTKIEGLNEKGKPLLNYKDRIVVGTHAGLYEIINDKARLVFDNWYIDFLYLSRATDRIYAGTYKKVYLIELVNNKWLIVKQFDEIQEDIFSICELSEDLVWFCGYQNAYKINMSGNEIDSIQSYSYGTRDFEPAFIKRNADDILFMRASGTYILKNDSIVPYTEDHLDIGEIPVNHYTDAELSWILQNNDWIRFGGGDSTRLATNTYLNLFNDIQDIYFDSDGNMWVIHENTFIEKIVVRDMASFNQIFSLNIQTINNEKGHRYAIGDLDISYRDRSLDFNISAPSFLKQNATRYQYIVDDLTYEWSDWSNNSVISFPVIPPGNYTMHIRARNILGQISNEKSIVFSINSPFWSSWWFITLMAICLIGLVYLIIRLRVQKLERDKLILEQKVRERTAEIERQKNEIAAQQKEIMDSIHYAQRIQSAILPKHEIINELLPENFILYLPRDIVSGDFYWMKSMGELVLFAAADCTGHGVPGAFMSMLGVSFLNEIVSKTEKLSASSVLENLRNLVKTTLSQTGKIGESKDGMDIALLIYDKKKRKCQFSGAYNPLYIIRKSELIEVKADRMPIGIYHSEEKEFTNNELQLQKGDCLYMFSDGYSDQIGGDNGKKFLSKTMKELLIQIHGESMSTQKDILQKNLSDWMGRFQQVDDVLVAGLRIT